MFTNLDKETLINHLSSELMVYLGVYAKPSSFPSTSLKLLSTLVYMNLMYLVYLRRAKLSQLKTENNRR